MATQPSNIGHYKNTNTKTITKCSGCSSSRNNNKNKNHSFKNILNKVKE